MKVLLVEDDHRVASALRAALAKEGFGISLARTGAEAMALVADEPDVILLDLNLPDDDGFTVCANIRRSRRTPIVMLTARSDPQARVQGLNLGADDYLIKPFHLAELVARIHAVSRRSHREPTATAVEGTLLLGRLQIDTLARSVTADGTPVPLSRKECDLLMLLARHPRVVFKREQIIAEVWRSNWSGYNRTLEVHVASLRQKLGLPGVITTVRGLGYRLGIPASSVGGR